MYPHGRRFCCTPFTAAIQVNSGVSKCNFERKKEKLSETKFLLQFPQYTSVPARHVCKVRSLCQQPPLLISSSWARDSKGRALTPSPGDSVFHWPLPFNQTRGTCYKNPVLRLWLVKSQPIWSEGNRKCEGRGLFICGTVKFDHAWHIPTDTDVSHCS